MSKMSMTQKLLSRRAKTKAVSPGEHLVVDVDRTYIHEPVMAVLLDRFYSTFGPKAKVWDPARIVCFQDHLVPIKDRASAHMIKLMDQFVREQQIKHYFPYGKNHGVCHIVMLEQGLAVPGEIIVAPDSHTVTCGSFNCFASGLGVFDIAVLMGCGKVWLTVPQAIKVHLEGKFRFGTGVKDLLLFLLQQKRMDWARGSSIEWCGPALETLSLDERATLCNMVAELGATNGIMSLNNEAREFLYAKGVQDFEEVTADTDAHYKEVLNIDLDQIQPMVACPHRPDNISSVFDLTQRKVQLHQVYVGSCTGGKLEDIIEFHEALADQSVCSEIRTIVVPATTEIYLKLLEMGIVRSLIDKGCVVESPGCKACYGVHGGVLGDDEICLATINRNFLGRMGNTKASIYLSSPYVAGISARRGYISWESLDN